MYYSTRIQRGPNNEQNTLPGSGLAGDEARAPTFRSVFKWEFIALRRLAWHPQDLHRYRNAPVHALQFQRTMRRATASCFFVVKYDNAPLVPRLIGSLKIVSNTLVLMIVELECIVMSEPAHRDPHRDGFSISRCPPSGQVVIRHPAGIYSAFSACNDKVIIICGLLHATVFHPGVTLRP